MASTYDLGVGVALVTILSYNQELCFPPPILSPRGGRSPFPGRKGLPQGPCGGVTALEAETWPWWLLRPLPQLRERSYCFAGDEL